MDNPATQVTQLLALVREGDSRGTDELLPLVYEELRRMARAQLSNERAGNTLQPTALVHEAYLRLVGTQDMSWNSRGHFFAAAAQAMRRILVDRARASHAKKRGGEHRRVEMDDQALAVEPGTQAMLLIEEALALLERYDVLKARIVMLRFFAGLTIEQIGQALDLPATQVKSHWVFARAWMYSQIRRIQGESEPGPHQGSGE